MISKKKRSSGRLSFSGRNHIRSLPNHPRQSKWGGYFRFHCKIGLKSAKNGVFCILFRPMGGCSPPPWLRYWTLPLSRLQNHKNDTNTFRRHLKTHFDKNIKIFVHEFWSRSYILGVLLFVIWRQQRHYSRGFVTTYYSWFQKSTEKLHDNLTVQENKLQRKQHRRVTAKKSINKTQNCITKAKLNLRAWIGKKTRSTPKFFLLNTLLKVWIKTNIFKVKTS